MIRRSRGPGLFTEHTPVMRNMLQRLRELLSENLDVSKPTFYTVIALFMALPFMGHYSLVTKGLPGCVMVTACTILLVMSLIVVDSTLFRRS